MPHTAPRRKQVFEASKTEWNRYLLAVRPVDVRTASPWLIAQESTVTNTEGFKLSGGRLAKDIRFRDVTAFLKVGRGPENPVNAAVKLIEETRRSGTLAFETPDATLESRLVELFGGRPARAGATVKAMFEDAIGVEPDHPEGAWAATLLGLMGKDAKSLRDGIFGPRKLSSGPRGELGIFSHDHTQVQSVSQTIVYEMVEPIIFNIAVEAAYLFPELKKLYDTIKDLKADWIGFGKDMARKAYEEKGLPVPQELEDEEMPAWDGGDTAPSAGDPVQVTRLLGDGFKDPQPGDDSINVEQSFVSLKFQGGYTDPSSNDDDGDAGDGLAGMLRRAGFTDPDPLLFSLSAGRLTFRLT